MIVMRERRVVKVVRTLLLLRIGIGLLLGHRLLVPGVGPVARLLGRRRVAVDGLCLMRGRCGLLVGPLAAIVSARVHLVGILVVAARLLVDATCYIRCVCARVCVCGQNATLCKQALEQYRTEAVSRGRRTGKAVALFGAHMGRIGPDAAAGRATRLAARPYPSPGGASAPAGAAACACHRRHRRRHPFLVPS